MADDDGLLMNFDVSDIGPLPAKTIYKGGRWTDRVKAKRVAKHWEKKKQNGAAAGGGSAEYSVTNNRTQQPRGHIGQKRKRVDDGSGEVDGREEDSVARSQLPRSKQRQDAPSGEKNQVVSSLWTYNPKPVSEPPAPVVTATEEEDEEVPQIPSNAPLNDGSTTFTTLGLSHALASHLIEKLHLKAPTAIQKAAIPDLISTDSDAFIQAQTGSGKTLTYLLPILNRVMALTSPDNNSAINKLDRSTGLFAIILAPTRELSRQIMAVLTTLSHVKHGPHWLVPCCITGGEKRKAEKARLRKGVNILVATPGRLLDHLENTESLDVSRLRWLVLDEGDRLMELGFEETIGKILDILQKRSHVGKNFDTPVGEGCLPKRRVTILCSATMKTNVQKLGDISLKEALYIKADKDTDTTTATDVDRDTSIGHNGENSREKEIVTSSINDTESTFIAPAQLRQSYIIAPPKQRLVTLYAVLKRAFMRQSANIKVIVFFSCADSVDFHFEVFSRKLQEEGKKEKDNTEERKREEKMMKENPASKNKKVKETDGDDDDDDSSSSDSSSDPNDQKDSTVKKNKPHTTPKKPLSPTNPAIRPAPLLHPTLLLHKLHGTLPQPIRTATLHSFTSTPKPNKPSDTTTNSPCPSLLFCTDVASRGLDLPNLDLVVQFDPPFSRDDYIHRIGRTARAGREGRAIIFLMPGPEEQYVEKVITPSTTPMGDIPQPTNQVKKMELEDVLVKGFLPPQQQQLNGPPSATRGKKQKNLAQAQKQMYENLATEFQLGVETWLLHPPTSSGRANNPLLTLAKRAWSSHIRAYTTHPISEKHIFPLKQLHVGHLAKAFGLRDRPADIHIPGLSHSSQTAKSSTLPAKGNQLLTGPAGKGKKKSLGPGDERRKRVWDAEDEVGKPAKGAGEGKDSEAAQRMWRMAKGMQLKGALRSEFNIG